MAFLRARQQWSDNKGVVMFAHVAVMTSAGRITCNVSARAKQIASIGDSAVCEYTVSAVVQSERLSL